MQRIALAACKLGNDPHNQEIAQCMLMDFGTNRQPDRDRLLLAAAYHTAMHRKYGDPRNRPAASAMPWASPNCTERETDHDSLDLAARPGLPPVFRAARFRHRHHPPTDRPRGAAIEKGMDQYGVLVFHDQHFNDESQLAFSRNFGELEEASGDLNWGKARRIEPRCERHLQPGQR